MPNAISRRAAAVLLALCGAGAGFSAWAFDEPDVEPEVVYVTSLGLVPASTSQQPALLLPRPHLPYVPEGEQTGAGQLVLGDIPFDVRTASAGAYTSLWDRIRASYGMQELDSPLVKEWENWYASRPDYVARMIARAERYLYYIVEEVEKRGMPSEIALLPMIESAYNPNAYSTAHASGIWQFIPSTAKLYGLKQNWWQDERRDVLAATRAALDYLEKLYETFGSWELALASYNWGEGAVARAVQRNEARGLKTDYLSLDMPAETRNYVPKLMAVKNIINRPEGYGLTLAEVPNRPYFTVVTTDRHIDVQLAAKLAEMSVEEFQALNPSHNRPVIRADTGQHILLPADRVEIFQANLEQYSSNLTSWQSYTIGKGERLERVAQRFGIALSKLKEVNSIPSRVRDLTGLTILVPAVGDEPGGDIAAAGFAAPLVTPAATAARAVKHIVKAGETLGSIANRYRTSVSQLAARNGIRNGKIRTGQALIVAEAPAGASARPAAKNTSSSRAAARSAAKPAARGNTKTTASAGARKGVDAKPAASHTAAGAKRKTQVAYTARTADGDAN